jgi:DNA modification methylase
MFRIFNHSSENMSEIKDQSIDLVVADPPYNIGIKYQDSIDKIPARTYFQMLKSVIREIARVIKPEGLILFLVPIRIRENGKDIEYERIIRKEFQDHELNLVNYHNILVDEDENAVSLKDWNSIKDNKDKHSLKLRFLVFSRKKKEFKDSREIQHFSFKPEQGHPCPFSREMVNFILSRYFESGFQVLDPFMGIGRLGEGVLRKGGSFFGYEIRKSYFDIAKKRMSKV